MAKKMKRVSESHPLAIKWIYADMREERRLLCPNCERKTTAKVTPRKPIYCSSCIMKLIEKAKLKPMRDLGPVPLHRTLRKRTYMRGKLKGAL